MPPVIPAAVRKTGEDPGKYPIEYPIEYRIEYRIQYRGADVLMKPAQSSPPARVLSYWNAKALQVLNGGA